MPRKRFTNEQIAFALRQVENDATVDEVCRKMGVSEPTFYRWKKQFVGMGVPEIRRLKQLEDENSKLQQLIERALAVTATLWPAVSQGFIFVHAGARLLTNTAGEPGAKVRRRFDGRLGAMQRHRDRVEGLAPALDHFAKVARSYRPGLFHAAAVADLPRTNNALEQLFGSQRYHERRATGLKTASPGAVLRGAVRLVAGIRTQAEVPSGRNLGRVDPIRWQALRRSLDIQRQARTQRTRFRRDPDAYLNALERHAQQHTLPS